MAERRKTIFHMRANISTSFLVCIHISLTCVLLSTAVICCTIANCDVKYFLMSINSVVSLLVDVLRSRNVNDVVGIITILNAVNRTSNIFHCYLYCY